MKVIDHEHYSWYLLEENDALFLNVLCNISFAYYTWMIQLNPEEMGEYKNQGRDYISRLSRDIQYSAPGASASTSIYNDRDVKEQFEADAGKAINEWNESQKT